MALISLPIQSQSVTKLFTVLKCKFLWKILIFNIKTYFNIKHELSD